METIVIKLTDNTRFSNDELFEFCVANKDLRIERDKEGNLVIMSPSGSNTSRINFQILGQFFRWTSENETLGIGFDSEGGFLLPDGSMKAADVAWVSMDKWTALTKEDRMRFAPIAPEFIIELKSPSDSLAALMTKMTEWISNGVQLGWLIDPQQQKAFVYRPGKPTETIGSFDSYLDGGNELPGFRLDLSKLKE
jgi:Uma2 family endonuclease